MAVDVEPVRRARIVSAIVYKGDIFAYGVNRKKSHPFQARFGKNEHAIYLHAEINAIYKAIMYVGFKDKLKDCTLYICRLKKDHSDKFISGLAKPCIGCQRCIAEFGISDVIYSTEGNNYEILL